MTAPDTEKGAYTSEAPSYPRQGLDIDKRDLQLGEGAGFFGDEELAKRYGYVSRGYAFLLSYHHLYSNHG